MVIWPQLKSLKSRFESKNANYLVMEILIKKGNLSNDKAFVKK